MTTLKKCSIWTGVFCLLTATALAQVPVTVTIDSQATGHVVPADFLGLSYEMQGVLPDTNGGHLFRPSNQALADMFHTLGIKNLRVGGNTADRLTVPVPVEADADSLFGFAKLAKVDVIYTLRIHAATAGVPQSMEMTGSANGGSNVFAAPTTDEDHVKKAVGMARHIQKNYGDLLMGFAIGNEPDVFSTNYTVFRDAWIQFVYAITNEAPGAKFCGPASTPTRVAWSRMFANEFASSGLIAAVTQHDYPGGDSRAATNRLVARARLLSPKRLEQYDKFYHVFGTTAISNHVPYRLEEANSLYDGGAEDVSDTFTSSLWCLDFLHWWAAHGCSGINLHTGDKVAARDMNKRCRYAVFWTSPEGYNVHPVGYGVKAFDLGGHGTTLPVKVSGVYDLDNPSGVNVTAYATRGDDKNYYVTVINKEFGNPPCDADVTMASDTAFKSGKVIYLTAPGGDIALKDGVTLGGTEIGDDGSWKGKWSKLKAVKGQFKVRVPAASAAVVRLTPR